MNNNEIIQWLLDGDISVQYQVNRDLLGRDDQILQNRIEKEGWGAEFLSYRQANGHWGTKFYHPKWKSSHYTLLDLKNLNISPSVAVISKTLEMIFEQDKADDGGILPIGDMRISDVCINGMVLNYASYFKVAEDHLKSVVDCILSQHMRDGGFNCRSNRSGARHSSLHTTISVAEGIFEYALNRYRYRRGELQRAEKDCREFILQHKLYQSDRTGQTIDKRMTMLSYPSRWKYDILRALDYFQLANVTYDQRMNDALKILLKKQRKDGRWPVQARHPGLVHFDMEKCGQPSRWNTLRALRVLKRYGRNFKDYRVVSSR